MANAILHGLSYSPWTERARWALEHHGIDFRYREHVPLLGEPILRLAARQPRGHRVTVPLLVRGDERVMGSLEIMTRADELGRGPSLGLDRPEVAQWDARLDPALQAMRRRVTRGILGDRDALTEAAAAAVPGVLAPLCRPVAATGARFLARKYGFDPAARADETATIAASLEELRAAIDDDDYIFGGFTAADIIAATTLQGVSPVEGHMNLGPHARRMWHHPELAERFADLLEWRDRIFRQHRRRS